MSAVLQRASTPTPAVVSHGRLRGFDSGAREIDSAEIRVEGQLPDWLRGGLLLNGPALWDLPKSNYRHWFDGLAMMHRIQFDEGPVRYRSRFVRSEDYRQSVSAGAPAFSAFDTRDPQSFIERLKHLKNPRVTDNPAVVMSRIGERWFATTESPYLVGFDPDTLETVGHMEFDDELGIQIMAAHGIMDRGGSYWNVGITLGPKCIYKLFRLQPGSTRRELVGSIRVAKAGYTHAFAMTPNHALIWETAMRAQPLGFLFSGRSYIHNFKWDAGYGSMLHAVSLADGSVRSWDLPAMMCFHAIQAYELGDEIVAELCIYEDATILSSFAARALASRRRAAVHAATEALPPAQRSQRRLARTVWRELRIAAGEPEPLQAGAGDSHLGHGPGCGPLEHLLRPHGAPGPRQRRATRLATAGCDAAGAAVCCAAGRQRRRRRRATGADAGRRRHGQRDRRGRRGDDAVPSHAARAAGHPLRFPRRLGRLKGASVALRLHRGSKRKSGGIWVE